VSIEEEEEEEEEYWINIEVTAIDETDGILCIKIWYMLWVDQGFEYRQDRRFDLLENCRSILTLLGSGHQKPA
jgi:hypothetical protein